MNQPLFDSHLKRVSYQHYITGKAAINSRIQEVPRVGGISFHILIGGRAWGRCRWQVFTILKQQATLATWASLKLLIS